MNIRVFNIRLSKEFCIVDQNRMNEFLDSVEVKLTSTNFVTTGTLDYWSAVVFYDTKKSLENPKKKEKPNFDDLCDKMLYVANNYEEVSDKTYQSAEYINKNMTWEKVSQKYIARCWEVLKETGNL